MSSVYKSILKNYFANSFGMGINFLNQIAMVPLFIKLWGVEKYADWILITALSSFFAMTNMGLNQATNNEFVIKYQNNNYKACRKLLLNSFLFIFLVGSVCIIICTIIAYLVGFKEILNVSVFSEMETNFIFIILLFNVFVKMHGGVYNGIYRVKSKAHVSAMIDNIVRLTEIIILFLGILMRIEIVSIFILYILPSLIAIVYRHLCTRKWFRINYSIKSFDRVTFKAIIKPSMAFMLMPLGSAISNQGMVFVINAILGPVTLVVFTTTRTLVNFLRSILNLFGNSIYPEISVAYGKNNKHTMYQIFYRSLGVTILTSLIITSLLLLFGETIYLNWTNHKIIFNYSFFCAMLAVLFISSIWTLSSVVLLATNNHSKFTGIFLLTQLAEIILVYLILRIYQNITVIPIVLFTVEMLLLFYTLNSVNKIFNSSYNEIYLSLVRETIYRSKKILNKNSK